MGGPQPQFLLVLDLIGTLLGLGIGVLGLRVLGLGVWGQGFTIVQLNFQIVPESKLKIERVKAFCF